MKTDIQTGMKILTRAELLRKKKNPKQLLKILAQQIFLKIVWEVYQSQAVTPFYTKKREYATYFCACEECLKKRSAV